MKKLDILVVGAHPDDAEIGCGGIIARYTHKGLNVGILDLSDGEPTPYGDKKTRLKEAKEAAKILGVNTRITLDMTNRYIENNIPNRIKISEIFRKYCPKIIISHPLTDWHPDHIACHHLVNAAKFQAKLTQTDSSYPEYSPQKVFYFHHTHQKSPKKIDFLVDTSDYMKMKISALEKYESQFIKNPKNRNFISDVQKRDAYFGTLINRKYAEAFHSPEFIKIEDFLLL